MDQTTRTNWLVAAVNVAAGLVILASSIYFLFLPRGGYEGGRNPWYGVTILFDRHTWEDLHAWVGAAMIAFLVIHFLRHWRWFVLQLRRTLHNARTGECPLSRGSRINLALNLSVAASFFLVAATGAYFFVLPDGGYQGGRNLDWDPGFLVSRTAWDIIHTWAGVVFIATAALHFWMHWGWIVKVTSRLFRSGRARADRPVPAGDTGA